MLKRDDPQYANTRKVAGIVDVIMGTAHDMTLAPSSVRREMLADLEPFFQELRELNREKFNDYEFTRTAIEEFEAGVRKLAALGDGRITEDRRDGEGDCPYCGVKITKIRLLGYGTSGEGHFLELCGSCNQLYMEAKSRMMGLMGFGTDV